MVLVLFNFAKTARDKESADDKATGLSNQLAQLSDQNRQLGDEVCNTRKALSDLLAVDSVKTNLDLSVRGEMLKVKREVDAGTKCTGNWGAIVATWSNKIAQAEQDRERFHQESATKQLNAIEPFLPIWDSTIKIFQSRLTEYLQPLNRKLIANCNGLQKTPAELARAYYPDGGYREEPTKVCEMSVGTNSDWSCTCETLIRPRNPGSSHFVLTSKWTDQQAVLNVSLHDDAVSTTISRSGTILTVTESHPVASNQTAMASVIDDFIAAQAAAFGVQP